MSDWTSMPRREKWTWAYLVICVLNLTYTIIGLCRGGGWKALAVAVLLLALAVLLMVRVRSRNKK